MNVIPSRIGRFVKAARALLLMQVIAAAIATALGVWAVVAVRDMAAERDRLQERVAELEKGQPAAPLSPSATPTPQGPPPSPLDTEVRPPAILAIPIPVTQPAATPVDPIEPTPPTPTPGTTTDTPPPPGVNGEPDCAGADANSPRCRRPGRWVVPEVVNRRPVPPATDVPQKQEAPR